VGGEKKRTYLGTIGLYIAKTYRIVRENNRIIHENGRTFVKSLSSTIGVKLNSTLDNP
jgi:hypothetical protein